MLKCKHKGILTNRVGNLKIIFNFTKWNVLIYSFYKRVLREDMRKYGKSINNSFLGTACFTIFCANCLFKNIFMDLWTKVVGKQFFLDTSFK